MPDSVSEPELETHQSASRIEPAVADAEQARAQRAAGDVLSARDVEPVQEDLDRLGTGVPVIASEREGTRDAQVEYVLAVGPTCAGRFHVYPAVALREERAVDQLPAAPRLPPELPVVNSDPETEFLWNIKHHGSLP